MEKNDKLKIFVSYSHIDEKYIEDFIKHIAPLKNNNLIEDWYDRKILSGQDIQSEIDNNFENADIICLFISANFLASNACMMEKKNAIELKRDKGIVVIPIILSTCGWLDDNDIYSSLALPIDGKPISDFENSNKAWNNVYEGLKDVIRNEIQIKQLTITKQFSDFLQNTELLTKAHSQKDTVLLENIFVYPELAKYNNLREYEKKIDSRILIDCFDDYPKILIAGENQSGKTTLCKQIFIDLRKKNFIPIYVSAKPHKYQGKIENLIIQAYKEQYKTIAIEEVDRKRIVPILDDFHFAKKKEKHIHDLSQYHHQIIVVDDIFSLNFRNETLINSFIHFKIEEFIPSLRNKLIKKWTHLTDHTNDITCDPNETYQRIDDNTELVNTTLGKIFGNGIMPANPFFILSIISTYETFAKPLDQEITSQGYCYQALIYMYLRKQGVKNDEVDTYINFLTEFAFFFHSTGKKEISSDEFNSFMKVYLEKYNLPINQETLLNRVQKSQIISLDSFNNYHFSYQYLYYFFVAKYLADHIDGNKEILDYIINNLHKDENSYIAIFVSHHSKNNYILDEIILNAYCLFDNCKPATLSEKELSFFDKQEDIIIKAVFPPSNTTPEIERDKKLITQDVVEKINIGKIEHITQDEENDDLAIELRRSIKTVEVMGRIIKNRAGSLEKPKLEAIFAEAMRVHLRLLTSFFEIIKKENDQQEVIDFLSTSLDKIIKEKSKERKKEGKPERTPTKKELEKISRSIFWNFNFFVIYGLVDKIINSLGSNKLTKIIETVCDNENTPASYLVKHGILMWYNKNLQIDNIEKRIDDDAFSETAQKIMRLMIVNHCSMHKIGFKEKQKIAHKFNIPSGELLTHTVTSRSNK